MSSRVILKAAIVVLLCSSLIAGAAPKFSGPTVLLSPAQLNSIDELGRALLYLPPPPYRAITNRQADQADRILLEKVPKWAQTFGRQYFAYLQGQTQTVQVRGFCPGLIKLYAGDPWWKSLPVDLMHTGSCVFLADIDLSKSQLVKFEWGVPDPDSGE